MAWALSTIHPHWVNIEPTGIMRPSNTAETDFRYGFYRFTQSYAVHVSAKFYTKGYQRHGKIWLLDKLDSFDCIESSFAEVARLILFNDFRSCLVTDEKRDFYLEEYKKSENYKMAAKKRELGEKPSFVEKSDYQTESNLDLKGK